MKGVIFVLFLANIGLNSCEMSGFTPSCSQQLQEIINSGQVEDYTKMRDSLLLTGRFLLPKDFARIHDGIQLLFSIMDAIPTPILPKSPIIRPAVTPYSNNYEYYDNNLICCKRLMESKTFFDTCAKSSQMNGDYIKVILQKSGDCESELGTTRRNLSDCLWENGNLIAKQGIVASTLTSETELDKPIESLA